MNKPVANDGLDRRWLKIFETTKRPTARLLCFPHAGGSAAAFRHWPKLLLREIQVVAVQPPGRADRFHEPPFKCLQDLVDELVDAVEPLLDSPFACYGVSMGARTAWTLAHTLRENGLPVPQQLFLACDPAPTVEPETWTWEQHPGRLEGYVRDLGGTPPEVLAEPALLTALLSVLEADLTALRDHEFYPSDRLDIPIHAFSALDDPDATPEQMRGWAALTRGKFVLETLRTGHFLDLAAETRIAQAVSKALTAHR